MQYVVPPIASSDLHRIGESLTLHRRGSNRPHKGLDLFADAGAPVYAPVDGVVLRVINGNVGSASQKRAGWFVDLRSNADGLIHRLLHLDSDAEHRIASGKRVSAGQRIGSVGRRGTSGVLHAKPHIHYEIAKSDFDEKKSPPDYGERVDPLTVLPEQYKNRGRAMSFLDDIDWRKTLDMVIDKAGPAIAVGLNDVEPGAGTVVGMALPIVKDEVVDRYVPTKDEPPSPPSKGIAAAPAPAAPASPEAQKTAALLASKGWTQEQVAQHLAGPDASQGGGQSGRDNRRMHPREFFHGVARQAGWHPDDTDAFLNGPYAFSDYYMRPQQHVPDEQLLGQMRGYNHRKIMEDNLHSSTERGGHTPENYHGTADAHVDGLGDITEYPGIEKIEEV